MHDLDLEVRVSRWPVGATALVLEPVTTEHPDAYKMPNFMIPAPVGTGPFQLGQQGRVALNVPNHFNARPFEFKYLARFEPRGSEQPVETVGQRTLLLEGIDLARQPLTGYQHVDRKLVETRNTLRVASHMVQKELTDALALAIPLANLAGQSVSDNVFDATCRRRSVGRFPRQDCPLVVRPRGQGGRWPLRTLPDALVKYRASATATKISDVAHLHGHLAGPRLLPKTGSSRSGAKNFADQSLGVETRSANCWPNLVWTWF